jgi:VCBS repeat-containing protein
MPCGPWVLHLKLESTEFNGVSLQNDLQLYDEIYTVRNSVTGAQQTIVLLDQNSDQNDAPVIGDGSQITGGVTETGLAADDTTPVSGPSTASGTMEATDADSGATLTWSTDAGAADSIYGSFAITAAGVWTYTLDNAAADSLAEGASATETFTVTVTDEFGANDTETVTITITGTNDAPVIGDSSQVVGGVTETGLAADDTTQVSGPSTASGTMVATDADSGATLTWSTDVAVVIDGTFTASEWAGATIATIGNGGGAAYFLADSNFVYGAFDITGWTSAMGADSGGNLLGFGVWSLDNGYPGDGVEFQQSTTEAAWGGGGNSGMMNGLLSAFRIDAGAPEASIPGTLQAMDSFATGHRVWEVKIPISSMAIVSDTVWVVGSINFDKKTHWYPESFVPAFDGYIPVPVSAPVAVDSFYGSFAITAAGVWTHTLDNAATDSLAQGESATETFTVTVTDEFGANDTETVTITITGTNDAPVIAVGGADTASATIAETNAGLTASGSLTVTDADSSDTVISAVSGVVATGTTGGLTNTALLAMLSVSPTSGLAADTGDANNLGWDFNSGSQAFDFLNVGQSLVLTYTVSSTDTFGANDTETVTITITGTADGVTIPPVVSDADPNDLDAEATGAAGGITVPSTGSADTLRGGSGNDSISSQGGNDTVYGGAGNDSILGNTGNDLIYGGSGNDTISGGNNNDAIYGGSGNDVITGNDNNDQIYGGHGADTLTGNDNNDTFMFLSTNDTGDTITDFNSQDRINLSSIDANLNVLNDQSFVFGGTTATANGVWYEVSGSNSTVYVDTDGNTSGAELVVFLTGVTSLAANDFVL